MSITDAQLDADQALCDAATEGPWDRRHGRVYREYVKRSGEQAERLICDAQGFGMENQQTDAAFIAAARTDWPKAIAEVRRLREISIRYLRALHDEFCSGGVEVENCHNCAIALTKVLGETQELTDDSA